MIQLGISHLGIRNGETITSSPSATQNKGTIMMVKSLNGSLIAYPPSKHWVEQLDVTTLRDKLNNYSFFSSMSQEERLKWLIDNSVPDKDLYLEDTPIKVKFVRISGKFFTANLTEEQINYLLRGNPDDSEGYWPITTVFNLIPRKAGSRPKKHTLIFRPSNWSLLPGESSISTFNGVYIDLDQLSFHSGSIESPKGGYLKVVRTDDLKELAIVSRFKRMDKLTWGGLLKLADSYSSEMERVKPLIEWFPPSLHKSLIQKIIRTRCTKVSHNGEYYSSPGVLLASISLLIIHPGSFVPNIQRFVTGLESIKRLAVSIFEDSFLEDNRLLVNILAPAIISQQDNNWIPTDSIVKFWFYAALTSLFDPRIYDRNNYHSQPIKEWNSLSLSYILLKELKSFHSDIEMVKNIMNNTGKPKSLPSRENKSLDVMPLVHCLDHHTYTTIGYYMGFDGSSFETKFKRIWDEMSSFNPRLEKFIDWTEDTPYRKDIRSAQRLLWLSKTVKPQPLPVTDQKVEFNWKLDDEWLPGLVGNMEVRLSNGTLAIVVLDTRDITKMTAIKKPSRDTKTTELTEEEKSWAKGEAIKLLSAGWKLKWVPSTLSLFKDATVFYYLNPSSEEVEYYIRFSSGVTIPWRDATSLKYVLPIHPYSPPSIERSLLYHGDGIISGANELWKLILHKTSINVLKRLVTYLEGNRSEIKMFKVGRDGKGLDYTVLPEDVGSYNILCYIACIYPAALSNRDTIFEVKNGPLLWSIRKSLEEYVRGGKKEKTLWVPPLSSGRKLWEHQKESLDHMKERFLSGKRGHEINIGTGLGKTSILLEYIVWLIETGVMPKYCVYTLPPSAVDSITKELKTYQLSYQILDMRKHKDEDKGNKLLPVMVNLLVHDHMRLNGMEEQLKSHANEMLFVVDEFHKTMNKTIRSSIALEIVRLSWDFVAMSGTIIKSTAMDELYEWMQQVVEFEINDHNYFVAVGALISRKVQTNIVVERMEVDASKNLDPNYYTLVPKSLGGTSDRLHFADALRYCYDAILEELINQTMGYLKIGEKVFVVVKDSSRQTEVKDILISKGVTNIHLITKDTPITLTGDTPNSISVVITTKQHVEGYTLVDRRIGIYELFLGNQTIYEQADGRMNRLSQKSPVIRIILIHAGILTYIMKRYQKARTLAEVLKGFAKDLKIEDAEILDK